MEYETADGSQFSLRTIESHHESGQRRRAYVSVSAFVDGKAYCGRIEKNIELLEDDEILNCLQPVPSECIHPPVPDGHPEARPSQPKSQYLKAPSFTFEDCQPGSTFVADCFLNEATVLEKLMKHPHRNLAKYDGAVVGDGRIRQLCLQRYDCSLTQYLRQHGSIIDREQRLMLLDDIKSGIQHLHDLEYAHNDINPDNICVDSDGRAVIVDFDSCLPYGQKLLKGVSSREKRHAKNTPPVSHPENDWSGLDYTADILLGHSDPGSDA
ncbi:3-phosphoinositide-dependent protein kinase [Teratosphaeria destructans]|uniref:3-phosphoinositide-dependent protein kinase n=1 Tax=Teratosphaeria destructans TaxID=418781 RepID=A0A9W7SHJ8_9PEZI|nr:3-phosphoinositide-dependent protein kinase [Teratosphaeria destructans]